MHRFVRTIALLACLVIASAFLLSACKKAGGGGDALDPAKLEENKAKFHELMKSAPKSP